MSFATRTAPPSIPRSSPMPSSGSSANRDYRGSGFMTFATHTRHVASQGRGADQGRERAIGPFDAGLHDGDLPARAAGHAGRGCENLCRPARSTYVSGLTVGLEHSHDSFPRFPPVEHPVEREVETLQRDGYDPLNRLSWWRGEDLNLRPSGYEWSIIRPWHEIRWFPILQNRC